MDKTRYVAQPVRRTHLRQYAKSLRKALGLEDAVYIDIVRLMEYVFPALFKRYGFSFEVCSKEEMGHNHGLTDPKSGKILIRNDVYEGACRGVGRDRMTIVHELGHFLLHDGVTLGLARAGEGEAIRTYCDPEWQATAFAAEFLMDHDVIAGMSVEDIVTRCGVSYEAADYQKRR